MANDRGSNEKERLQSISRGAFSGAPTPLKDIPKRSGESRAMPLRRQHIPSVAMLLDQLPHDARH
jgi:hypothetical protein